MSLFHTQVSKQSSCVSLGILLASFLLGSAVRLSHSNTETIFLSAALPIVRIFVMCKEIKNEG